MPENSIERPSILVSCSHEGIEIASILTSYLRRYADAVIWSEALDFRPGIEVLLDNLDRVDFAIFIISDKDLDKDNLTIRDNLLFELGLLLGRLGRSRTFVISIGNTELPTLISGTSFIKLESDDKKHLIDSMRDTAESLEKTIIGTQLPSRPSIELYSCFISYHSSDENFANQIYKDLRNVGIRCWFAPENLKVGDAFQSKIDEAIQIYDKVLVVLSDAAIHSSWVEYEVKRSLETEKTKNRTVLFPIRLDDAVLETSAPTFARLVKEKQIGNFTEWKNQQAYQKAFSRLVKDLTISLAVEASELHHA